MALRKHIRLPGYDYSRPGGYFVTICAASCRRLFGQIVNDLMRLNELGVLVQRSWEEIPLHYPEVTPDVFQIMPNHLHGILFLEETTGKSSRHSLGMIVGSFKAAASKRIRVEVGNPTFQVWQTNYHEHIIRDAECLSRVREYILHNPLKWELDRYNCDVRGRGEGDDWLDLLEQSSE